MSKSLAYLALLLMGASSLIAAPAPSHGIASWYGEAHRGKLMANGKKFDPDRLTAASWYYPLGTKLRVIWRDGTRRRSVTVTITDRGPADYLVRQGRIIDLAHEAFRRLAHPDIGLIPITVQVVSPG